MKFKTGDVITPNRNHHLFEAGVSDKYVLQVIDTSAPEMYILQVVGSLCGFTEVGHKAKRFIDDVDEYFDLSSTGAFVEEEIV